MADLQPLLPRKIPQSVFPPIAPDLGSVPAMTTPASAALGTIAPPSLSSITDNPRMVANSSDPLINRTSALEADIYKRENPIKPTTTLGKIGHVAANVGNVLGDIFAPGVMSAIPGTQLGNERIEGLDQSKIADVSKQQQTAAQTALTEAQPRLQQERIEATKLANHAKYSQLAAKAGQTMVIDPETGEPTFEDDPTSRAYQDRVALATMHQATADKDAITSEIAQNHYKPGTPEYAEAQRKLSQVDQRLGVAMAGLGLRAQGLQLRKENTQASLYGTDLDGNALPGATQITGDNGAMTTVGSKNAGHAITQQGAVGGFKDLSGSLVHTRTALQDFFNEGGSLADPKMAAALSSPEGVTSQVIHGWIQSGMSPRAVAALTALKQYHEQAGILRGATKGTASEAGAQRILDTAPTAGDANDVALSKLNEGQNVLDRLTPGVSTVAGGIHVKSPSHTAGTIRAIDPSGVLHEAPAGTPLPQGWKAQ